MGGNTLAVRTRTTLLFCLALTMLLGSVSSLSTYQQCLNCFYGNRTMAYYCQSNQQCLRLKSTQCSPANAIYHNYQCVQEFQDCTNVTFTETSVGQNLQFSFGLNAGNGCYIQINRQHMGSYGSMQIQFDDPTSILVFDQYDLNYQSGDVLGMPLASNGWAPRKVFVVNQGQQQSGFSVTFQAGLLSQHFSIFVTFLSVTAYMLFTL